jgi:hypothetical protein
MGIGESLAVKRNVRPDRNLHAKFDAGFVYCFVGLENDVQFLNYQEFPVSTVAAFGGIAAPVKWKPWVAQRRIRWPNGILATSGGRTTRYP